MSLDGRRICVHKGERQFWNGMREGVFGRAHPAVQATVKTGTVARSPS
jgi:hypothetical protein